MRDQKPRRVHENIRALLQSLLSGMVIFPVWIAAIGIMSPKFPLTNRYRLVTAVDWHWLSCSRISSFVMCSLITYRAICHYQQPGRHLDSTNAKKANQW
jgi:hypothetical protein